MQREERRKDGQTEGGGEEDMDVCVMMGVTQTERDWQAERGRYRERGEGTRQTDRGGETERLTVDRKGRDKRYREVREGKRQTETGRGNRNREWLAADRKGGDKRYRERGEG